MPLFINTCVLIARTQIAWTNCENYQLGNLHKQIFEFQILEHDCTLYQNFKSGFNVGHFNLSKTASFEEEIGFDFSCNLFSL